MFSFTMHYSDSFFSARYTDTKCTVASAPLTQSLACSNAQTNDYASGVGYCSKDPSVIPVPGTDFTTEMYVGPFLLLCVHFFSNTRVPSCAVISAPPALARPLTSSTPSSPTRCAF